MQVYQKLAQAVKVILHERYLESWGCRTPDRTMIGKHKENIAALLKHFSHECYIIEVRLKLKYSDNSQISFAVEYMNRASPRGTSLYGCEVRASLSDLFTVKVWGLKREDGIEAVKEYMLLQLMKEVDNG